MKRSVRGDLGVSPVMRGRSLILLVSFLWALMEIVAQHAAAGHSLLQVVWVRYAAHVLLMLAVFGPRHGRELVHTERPVLQLARALMMLVMPVSFLLASREMSARTVLSIFWLAPQIVMVLSMILLRESASWRSWAVGIAGLGCIVLLLQPQVPVTLRGTLLSLAMATSFALYIVLTRVLREESTVANLFYTAIGVLLPLSLWLPSFWSPLSLRGGLLMALVGCLGFALLWLLDLAMELISPAAVAPLFYAQVFWSIILQGLARGA
jgi:drug/metabolite transporter (DMT)-like permease